MKLPADTGPSLDRDHIIPTSNADVRYWHEADMPVALHMSAFGQEWTSRGIFQAIAPAAFFRDNFY